MPLARRDFLRLSLASAAFAGFPNLRLHAASPNGKINMAFVGIGNRGKTDFEMFSYYEDLVNIVAFCDTEMGGPRTLSVLNEHPEVPRYQDFRKMFDEKGKEIDAVCIATPDFSHFPVAMLAMSLGKAVYCEKPLGGTFREIALMAAAAKKHGVVTQMGNQGHSGANYYQCRALVERGYLKDVTRIVAHMNMDRRWFKWNGKLAALPAAQPVPDELDWDTWLAQRAERPYSEEYVNGNWRCFYDLGTGALGDWGAHLFDAAWEFLKLGLPEKIEVRKMEGYNKFVYPMASTLAYSFPSRGPGLPACTLEWYDGLDNRPAVPANLANKAWTMPACGAELFCADGRVFARGSHDAPLFLIAGGDSKDAKVKAELRDFPRHQPEHFQSFLLAVKGEAKTTSPFEVSAGLAQILVLGCIAQQLNQSALKFDRATNRFVDNPAANALLDGPAPRKGWEQYEKL